MITKEDIVKLHVENRISLAKIANQYGIKKWKIYRLSREHKIKTIYFKKDILDRNKIIKLYLSGLSVPKIVSLLGIKSFHPVYDIVREEKIIRNMSECHLGQKAYNKGKKMTLEQRKKLSQSRMGKYKGKDNPNWKNGLSKLSNNPKRQVIGYNEWRINVKKRDGKCLECGSVKKLVSHHIVPVRNITDINLLTDMNNGICLCKKCHIKTIYREKEYEIFYRALLEKAVNSGKTLTDKAEGNPDLSSEGQKVSEKEQRLESESQQ